MLPKCMKSIKVNESGTRWLLKDEEARTNIAEMQNDLIALRLAVGTPLVASTKASMTDTEKIYVYVGSETGMTSGHWYYYDSTLTTPAWVSGGTYNETALEPDTSLTVSGRAADAKVTGNIKKEFEASRIRDRSILFTLPFGNYTQGGDATNGYYITSSNTGMAMSEVRLATKPIVVRQKDPEDTSIKVAVQKYDTYLGDGKYTPSFSVVGWFDEDSKNCCTIMEGQYYWICFRDGNTPHQLTMDKIAQKYEVFETDAEFGYGSTHTTASQSGSAVGAMNTATQYAVDDILVTCDDWAHYGITYAEYASDDPDEILTHAQYASARVRDFVIPADTYYRLHIFKYDDSGSIIRPKSFNELQEHASHITMVPLRLRDDVYKNDRVDITGTKGIIASLAKRLDILEKENGINTIPSYYQDHIEDKVDTINGLRPDTNEGGQFIFITDIHVGGYVSRGGNAMNSHSLINYICQNTTINKVFNGGDLLNNDENYTIQRSVNRIRTAITYAQPDTTGNQFYIVGNHDGGYDYNGAGDTVSPRHITPELLTVESGLYSVSDIVRYDPNSPFQFYHDDDEAMIRYIVLDIGERDNATSEGWFNSFRFFADAMNSTPLDYTVVVFNHQSGYRRESDDIASSYYQYIYDAVDAFNAKTSYSVTAAVGKDFSNSVGEVACIICGHHHEDMDFETTGGVPIILTTTDNGGARKLSNTYIGDKTGTVEEQAFDVFTIDTENKTIYATRIGYGSDRTFTYGSDSEDEDSED